MGKSELPLIEAFLEIMRVYRNHDEFDPDLVRKIARQRYEAVPGFLLIIAVHVADLDNFTVLVLA